MTSPTPQEAKELRQQVLVEFKQVHKLAPADYTENCTNVVMSLVDSYVQALITKATEALLEDTKVALFPEYDKVTNPSYSFIISKKELDERLNRIRGKL